MVKAGDKAPDFNLQASTGDKIALKDLTGKTAVLYFYPKDDTPGCTKEACNFRDGYSQFKQKGVVILGVSPDSLESHLKFSGKYSLPFPLLADSDHQVAEKYGVWVEKNMGGKKSWGIKRSTFIIGPDGKIKHVYNDVNIEEHSKEILEFLD